MEMEQTNSTKRINVLFALIIGLALLCASSSIVNVLFNKFLNGYILCVLYIVCSFIIFLINYSKIHSRSFFVFIAFLLFSALFLLFSFASDISALKYAAPFFISVGLLCVLSTVDTKNVYLLRILCFCCLIGYFSTVVFSLPVLMESPGASRVLASKSFNNLWNSEYYTSRGLAAFGLIYALVVAVPLIMATFGTQRGFKKFLSFILLVLTMLVIGLSGYTTALIVTIAEFLFYFLFKIKNRLLKIIILFLGAAVVLFTLTSIANILNYLSDIIPIRAVSSHLVELADALGKDGVGSIERIQLIEKSINAFTHSPLIGVYVLNDGVKVGEHSSFFDILGGMGLFGFVPYILFFILYFRYIFNKLSARNYKNIWTLCSIVFHFLTIFNPIITNYEVVFAYMCAVPCTLLYFERRKIYESNRN